jgi:hypothetical protein
MQTAFDAIRAQLPGDRAVPGLFTTLGEFFRQYFFAMDREELPFNRAQRDWVKHASAGRVEHAALRLDPQHLGRGHADLHARPFPPLDDQFAATEPMEIGPYAGSPIRRGRFFNISGMSYGAISKPAVRALSRGARMAGCWMNTGEGGLSPYHLEGGRDIVFQIGTAKFGVRDADGNLDDDKLREVAAHRRSRCSRSSWPGRQARQGRHPARGQDHRRDRRDPRPAQGQDGISPNRHREVGQQRRPARPDRHMREVTGKPVGIKT